MTVEESAPFLFVGGPGPVRCLTAHSVDVEMEEKGIGTGVADPGGGLDSIEGGRAVGKGLT